MRSEAENTEDKSADVPLSPHGIRLCPTCRMPLAADNRGDFCPVCMLRNALSDTVEINGEGRAATAPSIVHHQFEHYELLRHDDGRPIELGRGAMGVTYKAFDVDLQCLVALKVIREKYLGDESARLRFLREARAAASLRHPNVASVFHLGRSGGNYFYAMEFVEGDTLEHLIKRSGQLEVKLAMEIVSQVAAGLSAVYKENLVHRDIKPSNIMVRFEEGPTATAKIIDLGLAKAANESSSEAAISLPGAFAGTPEFASPEQFAGMAVDIRSDLYSLGVTLWNMLTGKVPFQGSVAEIMNQHQQAPLPLEQLQGLPQPTRVLLQVLLKKNSASRFQTPAELLQVMPTVRGAIAAGRPVLKTIRIFVSSTGDVQKERNLAERAIRSIAAELNVPVRDSYAKCQRLAEEEGDPEHGGPKTQADIDGSIVLCPYFWEYQKYRPDTGHEAQIPKTTDFDLVICILWSRLGTLAASTLTLPDGALARSGTEYEFAWALERPGNENGHRSLKVYRNRSKPTPPLEPKEEREAFSREWDAVQEFFAHWEESREAKLAAAFKNYRNLEEFEELFREHLRDFLTARLEEETGQKSLRRKMPLWKSSPFRGLNVFSFEHAPIFHGRTKAVGEVLEALEDQARTQRPFVLILGASGSGKSSLLRAGVLPLLTRPESIEGIRLWRWALTRPGAGGSAGDCFDALAGALLESPGLPGLQDSESMNAVRDLATELREHSDSVAYRVRDALDHAAREWKIHYSHSLEEKERQLRSAGISEEADLACQRREKLELPKVRLALVVDQLEELFTSGFSLELRRKYISALAGLVRSGRVFLLAALRSDFYSSYQEFPDLIELAKPRGKFDLRPPTPSEIRNIIRLPAESAGLSFEQERETGQRLDQALRDAASATPESLPLLEHVLSLLYDAQSDRGDGLLRWSDYRELGELKGALARHAEKVFGTLPPHEQGAFPLVMRHLVTLGQGEEEVPNRRTVPYRDFVASGASDHAQKTGAKGFIDLFVEKRLFVADTDPNGQVTVSVAHEALLREWQRVKEWLAENREFLRMRDRLNSSLKLWLSRGKQKDDLLGPGLPLAEGEKLDKDFGPSLSRDELAYVHASIGERKRRRQIQERIRYAVTASITAALVAAVIFAVLSFRLYRRAEKAEGVANQAAKFMTTDLRDKLKPIGRLDLLNDVLKGVLDYYKKLLGGPDDSPEIEQQYCIALVNYGDVLLDQGNPSQALDLYQDALKIRRKLKKSTPNNPLLAAELAVNLQQIGNVFELRGDIGKALEHYQEARDIRSGLVGLAPQNLEWKRQLVRTFEKVGLIQQAQGEVSKALKSYLDSLDVAIQLRNLDPNSTAVQSEVWLLNARVGEALDAQKDRARALKYYGDSLSVAQGLKAQEPDNTEWQREVGLSEEHIGGILVTQGDLVRALESYQRSCDVRDKLCRRDPTNVLWEGDLALSYENRGSILNLEGDLDGALNMYRKALPHREALVKRDETNTDAQRDLEISHVEVGSVLLARGDFHGAWESCAHGLQIARKLAEKDQSNKGWQSDLSEVSERVGDVLKAQGYFREALTMYRNAMSIRTNLISRDARWQMEVAKNEEEIAEVLIAEGDCDQASELCRSAVKRNELLSAKEQNDTDVQSNLASTYEKLGEALVGQGKTGEALENFRISFRMIDSLVSKHPNNADWESAVAFTCLQIAHTLPLTAAASPEEIRTNLRRAQDILLRKKQRFALGVVDESRLGAVEEAIRNF
jgi:serine/threonine protein kinase/tetratricopeptide (TPR) repeat protein